MSYVRWFAMTATLDFYECRVTGPGCQSAHVNDRVVSTSSLDACGNLMVNPTQTDMWVKFASWTPQPVPGAQLGALKSKNVSPIGETIWKMPGPVGARFESARKVWRVLRQVDTGRCTPLRDAAGPSCVPNRQATLVGDESSCIKHETGARSAAA